jgi:hypothetical protein
MGLTGNLQTMLFADLLQWISLGLKTGTLVLSRGKEEKRIFFRHGKVIASASSNPREQLSQLLVSSARIGRDQVEKAFAAQGESRMLLGKILVMVDTISEKDLVRLLKLKAEEDLYDLFLWEEAEFRFLDDELPDKEMIPLHIDVTGVAMEGTRRFDEWRRALQVIPDLDVVPTLTGKAPAGTPDDVQEVVLQMIDGHRTLRAIADEGQISRFHLVDAVVKLMRDGQVVLEEKELTRQRDQREQLSRAATETSNLLNRAQEMLKAGKFEEALRGLKKAQGLSPEDQNVASALRGAETVIISELRKDGIALSRVPRILRPFEDITSMDFTPDEAFLLSRINGIWDVGSIVRISPMRESEALLILQRLRRDGIIDLGG